MPSFETFYKFNKLFTVSYFTKKNIIISKIARYSIAIPMWTGRIWVHTFIQLNTAFHIHKNGPIRPKVIYNDSFVKVHRPT